MNGLSSVLIRIWESNKERDPKASHAMRGCSHDYPVSLTIDFLRASSPLASIRPDYGSDSNPKDALPGTDSPRLTFMQYVFYAIIY